MAVPSRPTLSTGSTTFADGSVLPASDLEAVLTPLYSGFSNLDDSNIAAAANIDPSKVGDYSASASEQKTSTDPGTGSSLSAATTLEGEIESLRYTIERVALGISGGSHAVRYDGSSNVSMAWLDLPHRYGNLIFNGGFAIKTTGATSAPDGWTLVATPTNCALATAVASVGAGKVLNITANAADEGISQTRVGLKASTRYLFVCKARANSGTARVTIAGADSASQFRGVTLDTTSATFTTLKAVIQTDSTPTDIVISLLAHGNGDDVDFTQVALYECSADAIYPVSSVMVRTEVTTATVGFYPSGSLSSAFLDTAVIPPGPGYAICVRAKLDALNPTGATQNFVAALYENGTEKSSFRCASPDSSYVSPFLTWINTNPTPGTTYTYTCKGAGTSTAFNRNSAGSLVTAQCYLELELVKL